MVSLFLNLILFPSSGFSRSFGTMSGRLNRDPTSRLARIPVPQETKQARQRREALVSRKTNATLEAVEQLGKKRLNYQRVLNPESGDISLETTELGSTGARIVEIRATHQRRSF